MTNYVDFYKSTEQNAPPLTGQSNSLIAGPLAVLVDGFGWSSMAITSLTKSGTTATATVSAANGLKLRTGMILTISAATGSGGDPALYNITATITVASATTFTYTMGGTPSGNATGSPVASSLLPITSITKSGTTALVTMTNTNSTLVSGHHVVIAGCTGGDASTYNITAAIQVGGTWLATTAYALGAISINGGNFYIVRTAGTSAGSGGPTGTGTAITDGGVSWDYIGASSNTYFSYQMGGTPGSNAAGTPTYARAGLQWTRPFSAGTNSQTFRSADSTSPQHYLQVIDNAGTTGGAKEAQVYGAVAMSGDQAVSSGQFPTGTQAASGLCVRKSASADTTVREWTLSGDDRGFKFVPSTGESTGLVFSYFASEKSGDAYNTIIIGNGTFNTTSANSPWVACNIGGTLNATTAYCPRTQAQTGTSISVGLVLAAGGSTAAVIGGSTNGPLTFPSPANSGLYTAPILIMESTASIRGRLPGIFAPLHNAPFTQYDESTGVTGLSGVTLVAITVQHAGTNGQVLFDKFGPWT